MGASLESETTSATLGQEGVRKFNIMSNLDFLSIPLSQYIRNYLTFGKRLDSPPVIFGVNYFLRDREGRFLNGKEDKRVWLKWMELSVHGDVEAVTAPTGFIPRYDDLRRLFEEVLNKDYAREDYVRQFTIRIPENLAKLERISHIYYAQVPNSPQELFAVFDAQRTRLDDARQEFGDYISPLDLR